MKIFTKGLIYRNGEFIRPVDGVIETDDQILVDEMKLKGYEVEEKSKKKKSKEEAE